MNTSLEFRDSTWSGGVQFLIPTNATVLEANVTVTGVAGAIPTDDKVDFSTHSNSSDIWASHKEATGIIPPTVDPYNNTWTAVNATGLTGLKSDDGNYWHTRTPSNPTAAPWEWPLQLYHLRYDLMANATQLQVVWNGRGECQANTSFKYQTTIYLYSHTRDSWLEAKSYVSTMARDEWLNYTLDPDSMFISSNGSVDMAVVGPHANKTATISDFGHLYTDYAGLDVEVASGSTEYPNNVVMEFDGHDYTISSGPLNGSVVVGDGYGFKDRIQNYIDRQPGWANNTTIDLEFKVGRKTNGEVNVSDLHIVYTTEGGSIPNLPPRWIGPDVVAVEEDTDWTAVLDLDASFTDDHDHGDLVFEVESASETWLQVRLAWATGGNRTLEVKPAPDRYGDVNVTLGAMDLDGARALSPSLEVHVSPVPDAPTILDIGSKTAMELIPFITTIQVDDPDLPDDVLVFSDDSELFDINAADGTIVWTPTSDDVGNHSCTITVTDLMGLSDTATLTIEVENVNDPPRITSTDRIEALEGDEVIYQVVAGDADIVHGDVLAYSAWSIYVDVTIDPSSGLMSFQLDKGQVGAIEVVILVQDKEGASAQLTLVVDVANVNDPPTIEPLGPLTYDEGEQVSVRLSFDDPDLPLDLGEPEVLTITIDGPAWLAADELGWVSFTADQFMVGVHMVTYTVTDREDLSASIQVEWIILNVNDGPVITTDIPSELVAREEEPFSYLLEATDADGDTLSWSDDSELFEIGPSSGAISFTPTQTDVGAHVVTVTVSDGNGASASVSFDLVVENVNDAPVIVTVQPSDGTQYKQGELVRLSVEATDEDGDALTYLWMEGDTELGAGSPLNLKDLAPGSHTVTLVVTDGTANTKQTFEIVVEASEVSDDDEGILFTILLMLTLGIAVGVLTLYMFLKGRNGPEIPLM